MKLERFERFPLAHLPTPVEPLRRLSAHLGGPEIWIKRDDCTGLAGGGNKTRKLEYLLSDALAQGADTLVTIGGIQSNHTRQTAAAAARAGLRSVLVLERWVNWPDEQLRTRRKHSVEPYSRRPYRDRAWFRCISKRESCQCGRTRPFTGRCPVRHPIWCVRSPARWSRLRALRARDPAAKRGKWLAVLRRSTCDEQRQYLKPAWSLVLRRSARRAA